MASVSKAFCATALGLLIDDFAHGRNVTALPSGLTELTWHTRLGDLLPEWELMDTWASERANFRDILSHVSGVPRWGLLLMFLSFTHILMRLVMVGMTVRMGPQIPHRTWSRD